MHIWRLHTVSFHLYDIWKRHNYRGSRKISGCQEINRWMGNESTLYDVCHYTRVQTHRMYTTRSGLFHKVRTLSEDAATQFPQLQQNRAQAHGAWSCVRRGVWVPFVLCAQIFCEPKTSLKIKLYKKRKGNIESFRRSIFFKAMNKTHVTEYTVLLEKQYIW